MKLGNISQTVVPVPDFFFNKYSRKVETFSVPTKRQNKGNHYYREKDILSGNIDLNINHNPRINNRNPETLNRTKYIPIYNRGDFTSNSEMKHTYFPHIIDNSKSRTVYPTSEYEKYKDYMNKTNLNEFVQPKLRKELLSETYTLLERINENYDMKRWNDFDSKTNINRFYQTAYSPITDYIANKKSDRDVFTETLRDKAGSLRTINSIAKEKLMNTLKNTEYNKDDNGEVDNGKIDEMLDNCKGNLLKLKYENKEPFEYNENDKEFLEENQYITKRFQNTTLYKDLLSPTRMEFDEKKVVAKKKRFKVREGDNLVKKDKYSFNDKKLYQMQDDMWYRPLHKDHF